MRINEQDLLQKLGHGDTHAFALLFQQYYRDLVLYAGSYIKDITVCEDIVQELFIKLWTERAEVRNILSLKSFLLKSVQNSCLSQIRHEGIKNKYMILKSMDDLNMCKETEEYILYSELNDRLQEAMSYLTETQRQCFEMNKIRGLKQREIAEKLNMPLRTVELRIAEALKILKQHLREYFVLVLFLLLS